ncbi:TRAP transporter small permease subunit [Bacilliculturomica massiliensis]|uniref:TRAP transporter small permease subunit n=1 Tax=Bacilliculturomica massiliensis TaxID=1917867 RepID=UPI0013EF3B97|nr:TRAP transporter small permease subunit [Bacilliculturomica massiliensis]
MKALKKITQIIDTINEWAGSISAYSVIVLMVVVVFEVFSRRVFNQPTIWVYETTCFIYGFLIMMVAGYGLLHGSHVAVDLFSARLSERNQRILSICMYLVFFFPFVTLMLPAAVKFTQTAWIMKEHSWSQWGPPVYPIKTVIPISLALLWIQGLSEVLKSVIYLMTNKKTKPSAKTGEV